MRSCYLRSVDQFFEHLDRWSRFWGIVAILAAVLFLGPLCLNIFLK